MLALWLMLQMRLGLFDSGSVCGAVIGSQTHQIVMADDIHDPVQPVFDVPVGANRGGKALGGRLYAREEVAPFDRSFFVTPDLSLNHSHHGEVLKGGSDESILDSSRRPVPDTALPPRRPVPDAALPQQ